MFSEQLFCNPVIADAVFSFLSLKDIKNAALVCTSWRQMVEVPKYWRKAVMNISEFDEKMGIRMKTVRRVRHTQKGSDFGKLHLVKYLAENTDMVLDHLEVNEAWSKCSWFRLPIYDNVSK